MRVHQKNLLNNLKLILKSFERLQKCKIFGSEKRIQDFSNPVLFYNIILNISFNKHSEKINEICDYNFIL